MTVYYGVYIAPGVAYFPLDDADKKVSVRFTAPYNKTVCRIHIVPLSSVSSPTYRIGIQKDSNGRPSGEWLTSSTFKPSDLSPPGEWVIIPVSTITLEQFEIYHLVIEYEGGAIGPSNYIILKTYECRGPYLYPEGRPDWNLAILRSTDGGKSWLSYTNQTCPFLLEFNDGTGYGNPYYDFVARDIYGDNYHQMYFSVEKCMVVSSAMIHVIKVGSPAGDLDIVLRNETDSTELVSQTVSKDDIPTTWKDTIVQFPTPITLFSGKYYSLTLKSPDSALGDNYQWSSAVAYGTDFHHSCSWGGSENAHRKSTDGGLTWEKLPHSDLEMFLEEMFNVGLKTAPNGGL